MDSIVYIGDLDDPEIRWDEEWKPNKPNRISPFFPLLELSSEELEEKISMGEYVGKQTVWGAWVARVAKKDILDFFIKHFPEEGRFQVVRSPWMTERMQELSSFIAGLEKEKEYALVVFEP